MPNGLQHPFYATILYNFLSFYIILFFLGRIKMKPIKEGKVREIYDNGDSLIMVATDRISCYDVILKNKNIQKF